MKDKQQIEKLIEAYFECTLSEAEERELRLLLATTDEETEAVREAKAVMGFFAGKNLPGVGNVPGAKRPDTGQRGRWGRREEGAKRPGTGQLSRWGRRVAAGAVLAVAVGAAVLFGREEGDVCLMYADGRLIDNSELVLVQMHSELSAVASANACLDQAFLSELQSIGQALDETDTEQ